MGWAIALVAGGLAVGGVLVWLLLRAARESGRREGETAAALAVQAAAMQVAARDEGPAPGEVEVATETARTQGRLDAAQGDADAVARLARELFGGAGTGGVRAGSDGDAAAGTGAAGDGGDAGAAGGAELAHGADGRR